MLRGFLKAGIHSGLNRRLSRHLRVSNTLSVVFIVIALFTGLFFLAKDKDHPPSPRLLTALKVRVSLSILLVVVLVVSYQMGWLTGLDG